MSDSEAMSDEEFEKYDPDDDFSTRRRSALFDIDDEDVEDETEDETVGGKSDEQDLSQEYPSMAGLPEKDESVREKPDERDLSEEYPLMKKQMAEQEKTVSPERRTLDQEYPSMKDLKKS